MSNHIGEGRPRHEKESADRGSGRIVDLKKASEGENARDRRSLCMQGNELL